MTDGSDDPAARLAQLLQTKSCIVYDEDLPDREQPTVRYSVYGAPKTNELFVRVSNGSLAFVAVAQSAVLFPLMADRIFGLDAADERVALELADALWQKHRAKLVGKPRQGNRS